MDCNNQKKRPSHVFISYAHKDSERVLPLFDRMLEGNCNIWYDNGIEVGSEWPAQIQKSIESCAAFLPIITENLVESRNCRKEISYAVAAGKPILPLYLEDADLKYGLGLQLSAEKGLRRADFPSDAALLAALLADERIAPAILTEAISLDTLREILSLGVERGRLSSNFIQRRYCFGYRRAAAWIDAFHHFGFFSGITGKGYELSITEEGFHALYGRDENEILF